jgi:UDP-N-acetylglucosamine 2-epimerase (non-hydrolysing)
MDRVFFTDLEVRDPDHRFELKDQPPHDQVATTMRQIAPVAEGADLVVVHGDTNTTLAGALLASKLGRPLAHVEAGIRSFDKTMPEEVNRIVTDQLSRLLFAPTSIARENLERENVTEGIHVVGNTVVDALVANLPKAARPSRAVTQLGLQAGHYILLTFHRAENVDDPSRLARALDAFEAVSRETGMPIVFPIHPRTSKRLESSGLGPRVDGIANLQRIPPVGYLDMLALQKDAALVMTDSGGLQEEACYLRVPCVTLRENTERPETLDIGSNVLAGTDPDRILAAVRTQLARPRTWENPYGDGTTAKRIADIVDAFLG